MMSLSVGNLEQFLHRKEVVIDLDLGKIGFPDEAETKETPFDLNEWPLLLFLHIQGFSKVILLDPSPVLLESWIQRISDLEQVYIHDPESLNQDAVVWDALSESGEALIRCEKRPPQKPERLFTHNSTIPPLAAPLHMPSELVGRFVNELRMEKDIDILRRYVLLLNEFLRVENPGPVAERLLLRALHLCLENGVHELALELVQTHHELWEKMMGHEGVLETVLSYYDPKPHDIQLWSQIFQSIPSAKILESCISLRGHELENRAIKLLHYRCLRSPHEFLDSAFYGDLESQRLLVPSLYTAWAPAHYSALLNQVVRAVECDDMVNEWTQALLHVDAERALADLGRLFFGAGFFSKRPKADHQVALLKAILRYPPRSLKQFMPQFLKSMKQATKAKMAFQLHLWEEKARRS